MKKNKKYLGAVLAVTLTAGAVATATVSAIKILSDMAVNKEIPKVFDPLKNKIASTVVEDDVISNVKEKKRMLESLCEEDITITNRDGLKLTGRWYKHPSPKRILIAMHGWRSKWSIDFGAAAEFYHDLGCEILYPDQRSQGNSEGEHMGFGVLERYDCLDWINYVIDTVDNDLPIYLCGLSMGATTVLMTAGLDLPSRVKGIIADCGFTSPQDIWQHIMNNNLRISGRFAYSLASYFVSKKANLDPECSTVDALANSKTPVLFVHGEGDKFVPVEMTKRNYQACASEKFILTVPDAEHAMSFLKDPDGYSRAVIDFFDKFDNKTE